MDGSRFDALARALSGHRTRRGVVGGLLAGLVGIRTAGAACPPEQVAGAGGRCVCRTTGRPAIGGLCPCPAGRTRCGGTCVDTRSDPAHCGGCGASCDDGNRCTRDACVGGACVHAAISCDDGNACTINTCDPIEGCLAAPRDCDDGNACTVDTCDPIAGCVHTAVTCGLAPDGSGVCCGVCGGATPCCVNGTCGGCPPCVCPDGPNPVTLVDGSTLGSNGGAVCLAPCTSQADCPCGQFCVATIDLCLPGTPTTDCTALAEKPAGAYCADLMICS